MPRQEKGATVRIDTNGHANLIHKRDIIPELKGLIDSISISLNAESKEVYNKMCLPDFEEYAFDAIINFAKEAKKYIPKVELSIVGIPGVDLQKSEKIAKDLGVSFRIRTYYEEDYKK